MRWTDEQTALLRKLWEDGLSGGQIAKKIGGGLSRNAVIGKAFRIGCPHRFASNQSDAARQKIARTRSRARKRAIVFVPNGVIKPTKKERLRAELALIAMLPPIDPTITIATVGAGACLYMNGDPQTDGVLCGRVAHDGSWCVQHRNLVYQPSKPKARVTTVESEERRRFLRETQRRAAFEAGVAL